MKLVMPAPSSIQNYYYKKWDNFYCCYQNAYQNLGHIWPSFGGIHSWLNFDVLVVPYDWIKFKSEYSAFSIDEHLDYAKQSGMFVIIDKTSEHVHDENDFDDLYTNLKNHELLSRCVVFDNTQNEFMFEKYNVPHVYFPGYVWFYLHGKRIPVYKSSPSYQFLCLNNFHKPHRLATIITLDQKKLLSRTAWSYRQNINDEGVNVKKILPNYEKNMINFTVPKHLDQDEKNFDQNANLNNLYSDALSTLVTETDFLFDKTTSCSEKIYHAIFFGTVPIFIGTPNSLNVLREHGLDIYDDIIDHSYDHYIDPIQRFAKISDVIEHVSTLRQYQQIRSNLAVRILRNQLLINEKSHWIKESDFHANKFFAGNKISI